MSNEIILPDISLHELLTSKCGEAGLSLEEVCRRADTNSAVIRNWKREDPKTIAILKALLKAIEDLASEKK